MCSSSQILDLAVVYTASSLTLNTYLPDMRRAYPKGRDMSYKPFMPMICSYLDDMALIINIYRVNKREEHDIPYIFMHLLYEDAKRDAKTLRLAVVGMPGNTVH